MQHNTITLCCVQMAVKEDKSVERNCLHYKNVSRRTKFAPELVPNPEWQFDPDRTIEDQVAELPYVIIAYLIMSMIKSM